MIVIAAPGTAVTSSGVDTAAAAAAATKQRYTPLHRFYYYYLNRCSTYPSIFKLLIYYYS